MATHWYLFKNEKQLGPFSGRQIKELALLGKLNQDDLVQKGSDGSPVPAKKVQGLFGPDKFADQRPVVPNALTTSSPESLAPPQLPIKLHQRNPVTGPTAPVDRDAEANEQLTDSHAKPSSSIKPPTPPQLPPPVSQPEALTASRSQVQVHQKKVLDTSQPSVAKTSILASFNVSIDRLRDCCKGVYLGFRANMSPKSISGESEMGDHSSLTHRLKEAASGLLGTAKAAGQIAAAQSKKTKLNTIDLPASYLALGRLVLQSGRYTEQFPEEHKQIKKFDKEIANYNVRTESEGSDLKQKMQAGADNVKKAGLLKATQVKRDLLLRELGKNAHAAELSDTGFAEACENIEGVNSKVKLIDAEISRLSEIDKGKVVTPKRVLIGASILAVLWLIGLVVGPPIGRWANSKSDQVASAGGIDSNGDSLLPDELRAASSTNLTHLQTIVSEVQQAQKAAPGTIPNLFFSSNGKYLLAQFSSGVSVAGIEPRIWNLQSGKEVKPEAGEVDYFSTPAAFSATEDGIACVDGDFIRVWNLENSQATLSHSAEVGDLYEDLEQFGGGNLDVVWSDASTILLSGRTIGGYTQNFLAIFRLANGTYEEKIRHPSIPRIIVNGEKIETRNGRVAASPDGKYWAYQADVNLQIQDFQTSEVTQNVSLDSPGRDSSERLLNHEIRGGMHDEFSAELNPSVVFTPDSNLCILFDRQGISSYDTKTWRRAAQIDCNLPGNSSATRKLSYEVNRGGSVQTMVAFSSSDNRIALLSGEVKRTSRDAKTEYSIAIYDMQSGALISNISLGDDFSQLGNLADCDFTADGSSILVCMTGEGEWNESFNRSEAKWAAASWTTKDGSCNWSISRTDESPSQFRFDPSGAMLTYWTSSSREKNLSLVDTKAASNVQFDLAKGDEKWEAGDHSGAFNSYAKVVSSASRWFVQSDLPRLFSRLTDIYAENSDNDKCLDVVRYMESMEIPIELETDSGKRFLSNLYAERETEKRKLLAQRQKQAAEELEEIRKTNKAMFVPARRLSKKAFVAKMREVMADGRLDDNFTHAIFMYNSFQDVFGEPNSNVAWNGNRLIQFRCLDGSVQLEVINQGDMTVVVGLNIF